MLRRLARVCGSGASKVWCAPPWFRSRPTGNPVRHAGNPGRRAGLSAANRGRPPRFATETSIEHRDFQPQTAVGRPKLRSITAISNRNLVAKTATAARICFERGAGLSPCARNTMREEIGRDTSSSQHAGHAVRRNRTRSAAGTFSGHRQRSRRICHQRCGWPSLSDERLVQRVKSRVLSSTSRSSSERLGQPHLGWQILRLRWR